MVKRLLILTSLLSFAVISTFSQEVSNVNFSQQGKQILITYDLTSTRYYQKINIAVFVSTNGGKSYQGPLKQVSGNVGMEISEGKNNQITWDVLKEMPDFGGNVVFDIRATVIEQKPEKHFFAGYKGSNTAPLGLIVGLTGKVGYYLSVRTNPGYFESYAYETNGEVIFNYPEQGYYNYTGTDKTQRLSITAGVQFQVGRKVHLYLGGGYAKYGLLWEIEEYNWSDAKTGTQWVKHTGESFSGAEAEAGILLQFKHIFLTAGASSPGFKWVDCSFGAGVVF